MITIPTKSEKWISDLQKKILIISENGIYISQIVNRLQKNYNSKQTAWAAISRICKNLSKKNLLELQKKNSRVKYVQTTIQGKNLIRELCNDLEIIALNPSMRQFNDISKKIKKKINFSKNPEKLLNNEDMNKLILEILAKYGELSLKGLSHCIDLPELLLKNILNNLINSSYILRIKNPKEINDDNFQLNWGYLLLPIKNIENEE